MGEVGFDLLVNERKLEILYPMYTIEGVFTFLENYNHIKSSMYYNGDYDALIMLVDFEKALMESKLSEKELQVLTLVFIQDMKRVDVAKMFNVRKQTVQSWLKRAVEKIASYYAELEGENI